MDWLYLSYHSVGVFSVALLSGVMVFFLLTLKTKNIHTYWVTGVYLGFFLLFSGYTMGYSVFAEWGALHRWSSVGILVGMFSMVGIAYHYPTNDMPRESILGLSVAAILAFGGWGYFIFKTSTMERVFHFQSHSFTFEYGEGVAQIIAGLQLWAIIVLLRKTIRLSEYEGRYAQVLEESNRVFSGAWFKNIHIRFYIGFRKIIWPKGRSARATREFAFGLTFILLVAVTNILHKSGRISHDTYSHLFVIASMVAYILFFLSYMNNSLTPTTFMHKLVGFSLVTLLIMVGEVGLVSLRLSERSYDQERLGEVRDTKHYILDGKYERLPKSIAYVISRVDAKGVYREDFQVLFNRDNVLNVKEYLPGQRRQKELFIERESRIMVKQRGNITLEYARKVIGIRLELDKAPENQRLYRDAGTFFTHYDFTYGGTRYEVGYKYRDYRAYTHPTAQNLIVLIIISSLIILLVFPLLFSKSLLSPLKGLLTGVEKVNDGKLETHIPVTINDEIGYLSGSFNSMVDSIREAQGKLEKHAEELEHRVDERTMELRGKMEEVQELKVQQDGDYFLTSLLARPLILNANKSEIVKTEFYLKQKKEFSFRGRNADLGGDINISGNLRFRNPANPDNPERYIMLINADAMGKSMQGAGGSLVLGVVMNSIMARSARDNKVLDVTPEDWIINVHKELHSVFSAFDGSMCISATLFLIHENTGEALYFNAEHPHSVLLRNGNATFIEETLNLRKLGLESEFDFHVFRFQFAPGDIMILGSDGRDDIDLSPAGASQRILNYDENLFLKFVQDAQGDLDEIVTAINEFGALTDDLALLRMEFLGVEASRTQADVGELLARGRELYSSGHKSEALSTLRRAFALKKTDRELNRLLARLEFRELSTKAAIKLMEDYTSQAPKAREFWYYLAIGRKSLGDHQGALKAALELDQLDPQHLNNLINLADIYRHLQKLDQAAAYLKRAHELAPENKNVAKMEGLLKRG